MHKVIDPTHKPLPNGKPPFPVLILHGLFQSSGSFVTSEERSLAFWLARQGGYSVYLGNTRGVFDMGHRNLSRGDPRFWGEFPIYRFSVRFWAVGSYRLWAPQLGRPGR